jgi:hypothetical protein
VGFKGVIKSKVTQYSYKSSSLGYGPYILTIVPFRMIARTDLSSAFVFRSPIRQFTVISTRICVVLISELEEQIIFGRRTVNDCG